LLCDPADVGEGHPAQDVLVKRGMAEQRLGDLALALGEFEQTIEATRVGKREHIGASA